MRKTLALVVFFAVSASVYAQYRDDGFRSSGYYFRPPRSTFYYRTDYLFQPQFGYYEPYFSRPYGYGYGFGGSCSYGLQSYSLFPGYSRYDYLADGWSAAARRTYSAYLQSPSGELVRSNSSDLVFRVSPPQAQLFLDGKHIGSARDYRDRDRYLVLDGMHELRVEYPGYKPFRADLKVEANRTVRLEVKLDPAPRR